MMEMHSAVDSGELHLVQQLASLHYPGALRIADHPPRIVVLLRRAIMARTDGPNLWH
jgi:hypothetical protein